MEIDVHIYGVSARTDMILGTKNKLAVPSNHIHYDDRPDGGSVLYTARKAWLSPINHNITHRVVFQDDVEVCDNFQEVASQIAEAHPKDIISFFPFEFQAKNPEIEGHDTPYFKVHILSGCGIMMPVEYIKPCFEYIEAQYGDGIADDGGIFAWADSAGVQILTTIPALVQHIGDDSIANPNAPIRRTVYYEQNPKANWESQKVMQYRLYEWFFSNHGKPRTVKGKLSIVSD